MGNVIERAAHRPRTITCAICGQEAIVHSAQARICGRRACRIERNKRSRAKRKGES